MAHNGGCVKTPPDRDGPWASRRVGPPSGRKWPRAGTASGLHPVHRTQHRPARMSMFNGYSFNERCILSLGVADADVKVGDILTLVWGEPEPTGKTSTERHKQAVLLPARMARDSADRRKPSRLRLLRTAQRPRPL
jgi:hypothetical protein